MTINNAKLKKKVKMFADERYRYKAGERVLEAALRHTALAVNPCAIVQART